MNFQVRDLIRIGDECLEGYLKELYLFTMECYKTGNVGMMFKASIFNHLWSRICNETMPMDVVYQEKINEIGEHICKTYILESIKIIGNSNYEEEEDDVEERTDY